MKKGRIKEKRERRPRKLVKVAPHRMFYTTITYLICFYFIGIDGILLYEAFHVFIVILPIFADSASNLLVPKIYINIYDEKGKRCLLSIEKADMRQGSSECCKAQTISEKKEDAQIDLTNTIIPFLAELKGLLIQHLIYIVSAPISHEQV